MSCTFRDRRSIFGDLCHHFAWQAQHFRHVPLRASHFTLYTLHSTLYTLRTLYSTLYTLHSSLPTVHSTLYTFTLHTQHTFKTLHTPTSKLCTPPSSAFRSLQRASASRGKNVQDCSNNLFHKSVLRDCIRVRGLHLVLCAKARNG